MSTTTSDQYAAILSETFASCARQLATANATRGFCEDEMRKLPATFSEYYLPQSAQEHVRIFVLFVIIMAWQSMARTIRAGVFFCKHACRPPAPDTADATAMTILNHEDAKHTSQTSQSTSSAVSSDKPVSKPTRRCVAYVNYWILAEAVVRLVVLVALGYTAYCLVLTILLTPWQDAPANLIQRAMMWFGQVQLTSTLLFAASAAHGGVSAVVTEVIRLYFAGYVNSIEMLVRAFIPPTTTTCYVQYHAPQHKLLHGGGGSDSVSLVYPPAPGATEQHRQAFFRFHGKNQ